MDNLILIFLISLAIVNCQVVEYFGPTNLKEGDDILISCYFSNQQPGIVKWRRQAQEYTEKCTVTQNDGTLKASDTCYNSSGGSAANYTFQLLNISYNRDAQREWNCIITQAVYLILDIEVPLPQIVYENQCQTFNAKEDITLTARTGCFYPTSEVHWCVRLNNVDQCSDTDLNYWEGVFSKEPSITVTANGSCPDYKDEFVRQVTSTLTGTTEAANENLGAVIVYPKIGSVVPSDLCMQIVLKKSCPVILSSFAICVAVIVLILSIVLLAMYFYKNTRPKNTSEMSNDSTKVDPASNIYFYIGCLIGIAVAEILLLAALIMNIQTDCLWGLVVCPILMVGLVVVIVVICYVLKAIKDKVDERNQFENIHVGNSNKVNPEFRISIEGIPVTNVAQPRQLPKIN